MTRTYRLAGLSLVALSALCLAAISEDKARPHPVEGAWKQVESKNGGA